MVKENRRCRICFLFTERYFVVSVRIYSTKIISPKKLKKMKTELIPQIAKDDFEKIKSTIKSHESPVGIDALQTHIIIIQKLTDIQNRLDKMEEQWMTPLMQ